jgi:hypothetical protein
MMPLVAVDHTFFFSFVFTSVLLEHTRLDPNRLNSPSLAAIHCYQIARSASRALGLRVVRISNVHDDLGVDVFVSGVAAASSGLAFGRCAPALGETGVWEEEALAMCLESKW